MNPIVQKDPSEFITIKEQYSFCSRSTSLLMRLNLGHTFLRRLEECGCDEGFQVRPDDLVPQRTQPSTSCPEFLGDSERRVPWYSQAAYEGKENVPQNLGGAEGLNLDACTGNSRSGRFELVHRVYRARLQFSRRFNESCRNNGRSFPGGRSVVLVMVSIIF